MSNEESAFSDLVKPPKLPEASDVLFTSQKDWWNNAFVNWCHDQWDIYANGYKEAADLLVGLVEARALGAYQDSLVYPVIFLYRQYLELSIKGLLRDARRLQDVHDKMPFHHKIDNIWHQCKKLLDEISPGESEEELDQITRPLGDFAKVDPTSMAFRYPHDKKGAPSLEGLTHINLRNVKDIIDKISVILIGAQAQVGEYLGYKEDMERDAGR